VTPFEIYCQQREKEARAAQLSGFYTIEDAAAGYGLVPLGNDWTRQVFDGDFYRMPAAAGHRPAISLVFVQSRDGNTVADNPSTLGGGETDLHLVYEGLSRIDADGVLAGAATARSERILFSVWHPALVELRRSRGQHRHPAQIVLTDSGNVPIERGLMFNEPSLRVFIITRSSTAAGLRARLGDRRWVEIIDAGDPVSLTQAVESLHAKGIHVISAIGGRRTATMLLRERLVSELYLTTSPIDAGQPNTPYCEPPAPALTRVLLKKGKGSEAGVTFEHLLIR
jgi:riboflavin biosynthesis pyrimidine reductase